MLAVIQVGLGRARPARRGPRGAAGRARRERRSGPGSRRTGGRAARLPGADVDVGERPKVGEEIRVTVHYTSVTDLPLVGVLFPDPDLHATSVIRVER